VVGATALGNGEVSLEAVGVADAAGAAEAVGGCLALDAASRFLGPELPPVAFGFFRAELAWLVFGRLLVLVGDNGRAEGGGAG
jgi:hypothetical protein